MAGTKHIVDTARIVWSGDAQIVELPIGYTFDTGEVSVRRDGKAVILEPVRRDWDWLQARVEPFDDDVTAAIEQPVQQQERPELDDL